ncbi:MAG: Chaperone protein DnaK [Planctomycetota bacterium]|jgi:molecular chaperone DnaK (HSP70)
MPESAPSAQHQRKPVAPDPIVGIDLGTTNSLVAYCSDAGPRVLGGGAEGRIVPSVVRYGADGTVVVGEAARSGRAEHAARTVTSSKRLMGRSARETAAFAAGGSAALVEGPRGLAALEVGGRVVLPQEVAAEILRELRRVAEADLGTAVHRAVITVPAYFDDAQRQATRDAARLAGLEAVRIVNEPTAASLAYGLGQSNRGERIAVYDLGGGTFDVTVLDIVPSAEGGSGADCFQVLATAGDTALGGDDIDRAIAAHWMERDGFAADGLDRALVVEAAERAKVLLGDAASASVEVALQGGARACALTREELDRIAEPFVTRTLAACTRAMRDAQTTAAEIDRVVLVGGSTRLAAVRAAVSRHFGREPYLALDPDRVVALGASVQAAIVAGGRRDLLLLDVIPLSLGIETVGGAVAKLVMRNSPIPAKAHEHFSTSKDGQTSVRIHVVQGERELAEHCRSLGTFDLRGIPPMPAGIPQIDVSFLVDQNGVLAVKALEKRSGREASIQVVPSYGLTNDEVDRIERESVEHARADMTLHRVIDLRVHSELDLKWIGEALARVRTRLEPGYVAELEDAMAGVRGFCERAVNDPRSVDADAFHRAKQALDVLSMRVHETAIAESLRGTGASG